MAWSVYGGSFGGLGPGVAGRSGGGSSGAGAASGSGESTAVLDAALARAQQGIAGAQQEFWKLAMAGPSWYFLCNPDQAKQILEKTEAERTGSVPQPMLWTVNGKAMIGVFTSEAAAMETHRQVHNAAADVANDQLPPAAILSMPVAEAINWLSMIPSDKVSDIVVNRRANVTVAHLPIAMLVGMYEWATNSMPDALWDLFIKSVQQANQPAGWGRLRARFAAIRTWWLPADPGGSNTPLVVLDGERKFLVLATHSDAAQRAFQTIVGKDSKPRVGPLPREKLLQLLDAIGAEVNGPKEVAINLGGTPAVVALADLTKIVRGF